MTPPPDIDPDFMPVPVLQIRDAEMLKVLSDPTRMRMLEVMVSRQDPAWSVKELAAALGVPQTRLYHHVDLLAEHGILRAVGQRVVSGIIETRYRIAARSFQLDRRLFAGDADAARDALSGMLEAVFDRARAEVEETVRADPAVLAKDTPVHRQVFLSRLVTRLTPAMAEELRRRLEALEDEFDNDDGEDGSPYGMVVALYPIAALPEA